MSDMRRDLLGLLRQENAENAASAKRILAREGIDLRMPRVLLDVFVPGVPIPQGSKKAFIIKKLGRAVIVEDNKRTKPWREAVKYAAIAARQGTAPRGSAVRLDLALVFPRPKGHFRLDGTLRPGAPKDHVVKPDRDKCLRLISDSLTDANVYADDSQVVMGGTSKRYAEPGEDPGAHILAEVLNG
jgi:Holliday junction resolvase RusA-like endonuclease